MSQEAAAMTGELMLGHLYEAAKALLTDLNHPEGDCAICLEPLRDADGNETLQPVQKLPCYHCLHRQASSYKHLVLDYINKQTME